MSSGVSEDHGHNSHDIGGIGSTFDRETSPKKLSRSKYIQRMQDEKIPQDPRKDRARVLGSVLNGDDDSLLFSVQESFASSQPFVDDRNDYESRGENSAIVSMDTKRTKTNLKGISNDSVYSPIESLKDGTNVSNQTNKKYSAILKSQQTKTPPLAENVSEDVDLSDIDLDSILGEHVKANTRDSYHEEEMKPEERANPTDTENNRHTNVDSTTDCGASLSVVLDDVSVSGTTLTSIREETYHAADITNDNEESISNGQKETTNDVDSVDVIYDRDCDSTIKTETSQGQIDVITDDEDLDVDGIEPLETTDSSKHFDNNQEYVETVALNRSVSWDPHVVTKLTKNTAPKMYAKKVHPGADSRSTQEFLSSNPHLFAISEDSTGPRQDPPLRNDFDDSGNDDKDSKEMVSWKSLCGKVCKSPKLILLSCVVLLVIGTVISAVFVSKDKPDDREQNISSLRGVDGEILAKEPSTTPSSTSSTYPSITPSSDPTTLPSSSPSSSPSTSPSTSPSITHTMFPTTSPSITHSMSPSSSPSISPSMLPTKTPSFLPSSIPSIKPSMSPTTFPSSYPSAVPTSTPSFIPTLTQNPSDLPSISKTPTFQPSTIPSLNPSLSFRTKAITSKIVNFADVSSSLDLSTGQSKALSWILHEDPMQIAEDNNGLQERYALYLVYETLVGNAWNDDESWLSASHICDWKFVICNENKSVYSLTLDTNSLKGTIPSEIGFFSNIESISFDENEISGTIPSEVGQLSNLKYLSMKSNLLTGVVPEDIFDLGIKYLDISSNALSGKLSPKIKGLSELSFLYLSSNAITGSIPREIGELKKLEILHMTNSLYNGTIPSELGDLKDLKDLRLKENSLSGQIPREFGQMKHLETLFIYKNKLTGELPEELYTLNKLSDFRFFSNQITGELSSSIGLMSSLVKLAGHSNGLEGSIPSEIGMLTNMNLFYMYDNNLNGNIPEEISNIKFLQKLSLSLNKLNGTLPNTFEGLTDLTYLSLWSNKLTGLVPAGLGNLAQLTDLFLDGNSFHGSIPSSICALKEKSLSKLYADCNTEVSCTCCTRCF